MRVLLDTNILTALTQKSHLQYKVTKSSLKLLVDRSDTLIILPQNVYEFWAVATRPAGAPNGLG